MSDLMFSTDVKAEDSSLYADMRLRLLIRQSVVEATDPARHGGAELSLDEAIHILEDEVLYFQKRIKR